MADAFYQVQVTIPHGGGMPRDAAQNTWAFRHLDDALHLSDSTAILTRLDAFYTSCVGLFASYMNPAVMGVKMFDLTETPPRAPFIETTMAISGWANSGADLPPEVAICMSFKGESTSGAYLRRRRGRIYLGPLQSGSATETYRLSATHMSTVANAGEALRLANTDLEWCVYSRANHHGVPYGGNINEKDPETGFPVYPEVPSLLSTAFELVTSLWVDDSWDTQRRRGVPATTRQSRP